MIRPRSALFLRTVPHFGTERSPWVEQPCCCCCEASVSWQSGQGPPVKQLPPNGARSSKSKFGGGEARR
ncbi:unnamed protein product [Ixodes persulcatus]